LHLSRFSTGAAKMDAFLVWSHANKNHSQLDAK
jgi:hypothetical protein